MIALTFSQEKFAQGVVRGLTQSDAYREAYPSSLQWKDDSVHNKASALARDARVVARVALLRAPIVARMQYGVEQAMEEAMEAFRVARDTQQAGAMVAAATLRSKLNGLLIEKREVGGAGAFAGFSAERKVEMLNFVQSEMDRRKRLGQLPDDVSDVEIKG